jgi:hypothetical protein
MAVNLVTTADMPDLHLSTRDKNPYPYQKAMVSLTELPTQLFTLKLILKKAMQ